MDKVGAVNLGQPLFKGDPSDAAVDFSVAFTKWDGVGDCAIAEATGKGIVGDGAGDSAVGHGLDVFPAEFAFGGFAGEADAGEVFAVGEDDSPGLVVVSFFFRTGA